MCFVCRFLYIKRRQYSRSVFMYGNMKEFSLYRFLRTYNVNKHWCNVCNKEAHLRFKCDNSERLNFIKSLFIASCRKTFVSWSHFSLPCLCQNKSKQSIDRLCAYVCAIKWGNQLKIELCTLQCCDKIRNYFNHISLNWIENKL